MGHKRKRFSGKIRGRSYLHIFGENEFVLKRLPPSLSLPPSFPRHSLVNHQLLVERASERPRPLGRLKCNKGPRYRPKETRS